MKYQVLKEADTKTLLESVIRGEVGAFDVFYLRFYRFIESNIVKTFQKYGVFKKNGNAYNYLEDIVQGIFIRLIDNECERLKNFRGVPKENCEGGYIKEYEKKFLAYLGITCVNYTIDYLRDPGTHFSNMDLSEFESENALIQTKEIRDLLEKIQTYIKSDNQKTLLGLYLKGYSTDQICTIMDMKRNAYHQLLWRLRQNIINISKKKRLFRTLKELYLSSLHKS